MDPLREVADHIEGTIDDGLTAEKVLKRGHVIESTEETVIFEAERHKRASGAGYTEGRGMNAFITYWPRYQYDRESEELNPLEEQRPREFSCDYGRLASESLRGTFNLQVEPDDQAWCCTEMVGGTEASVKNLEDVKSFAESQVRGWDLEIFHGSAELQDILDKEEFEKHFSKLEDALVREAHRQAQDAWE
jgi:hypothetical protein